MVAVIATLICVVSALWYMKRNKEMIINKTY